MAEKGDSEVLRLVVAFLRGKVRMSQMELGRAARIDQSEISDYERGVKAPSEDQLRRMAQVAGVPWHLVVHLTRFVASVLAATARASSRTSRAERAILDTALLALMPYMLEQEEELTTSDTDLLQEAEEIWSTLEGLPMEERRRRIETAPPEACRSWAALTRVVCEASERSAADSATAALELAELALYVAEKDQATRRHNPAAMHGGISPTPGE